MIKALAHIVIQISFFAVISHASPKAPTCIPITVTPIPTVTKTSTPAPTQDQIDAIAYGTWTPTPTIPWTNTPAPTSSPTLEPTCNPTASCTPKPCYDVLSTHTPTPTTTPRADCDCRGDYTWWMEAPPTPSISYHVYTVSDIQDFGVCPYYHLVVGYRDLIVLRQKIEWIEKDNTEAPCGEAMNSDVTFTAGQTSGINATLAAYCVTFGITFEMNTTKTFSYNPQLSAEDCIKKKLVFWQKQHFFEQIYIHYHFNSVTMNWQQYSTQTDWTQEVWTTEKSFRVNPILS